MNESRDTGASTEKKRQLIELFLQRTVADVEHMRRSVPQLIAGDPPTWRELRFMAQRAACMAKTFELEALEACARDLSSLADQKLAGASHDVHFLLGVTSAIDLLADEVERLATGRF